ncbi:MAG: adenylate kinase [Actinomycetota bacterium]|nr:adenylate kinase [Actinomycetota bacterium]
MVHNDLPRADRHVGIVQLGIVMVAGPPGSGKGTQCELLAQAYGWPHLSSGALFRDEIARKTPSGERLRSTIEAGSFVPDDLTVEIVLGALEAMTVDNVLLDGFPRTLPQTHALLARVPRFVVRVAIELVVPAGVAFDRLVRRSRSDDETAAIRRRLALYESETRPALDWLAGLGLLATVDGDQPPEAVGAAIGARLAALDDSMATPR